MILIPDLNRLIMVRGRLTTFFAGTTLSALLFLLATGWLLAVFGTVRLVPALVTVGWAELVLLLVDWLVFATLVAAGEFGLLAGSAFAQMMRQQVAKKSNLIP